MKFVAVFACMVVSALAAAISADVPPGSDIAAPAGSPVNTVEGPLNSTSPDAAGELITGNLHVEIGGSRQHVGATKNLKAEVRNCLRNDLCDRPGCYVGEDDKYCRINNVCYNAKGRLSCEAHLQVRVTRVDYDEVPAQLDNLIEAAAIAYDEQTGKTPNCYTIKLSGKDQFFCNVGSTTMVRANAGANKWGVLNVHLNFNGPSRDGPPYDCSQAPQGIAEKLYDEVSANIAKSYGIGFFETFATCRKRE